MRSSAVLLALAATLVTLGLPAAAGAGIHCPQPILENLFRTIRPEHRGPFGPGARTATLPPPAQGEVRSLWMWDFAVMPPGFKRVEATCARVTEHAYVFVESSLLGGAVTEAAVDTIAKAFEAQVPADPSRGIWQVDTATFGEPPDSLDADGRVYLLYAAFASFGPQAFDGYFNAFDQMPDAEASGTYQQHSNEVEILYMNATGKQGPASDYMLSVLAHEFQHLIHWRYDPTEESWVGEAMSEAAMTACGYFTDQAHLASWCRKPETPLVSLNRVSYGAALLFGTWLLENGGPGLLRAVVSRPEPGIAGLEAALAEAGLPQDFDALFHRWAAANAAGAAQATPPGEFALGYRSFPVPPVAALSVSVAGGTFAPKVPASGLAYLKLADGGPWSVRVETPAPPPAPPSGPPGTSPRELRRRGQARALDGERASGPALFRLAQGTDLAWSLSELVPGPDSVFAVPSGPCFLVLSTLRGGGPQLTLTVWRAEAASY